MIEARQLSSGYGPVIVVRDLDLEVHPGEVVALLGPNGAGKTTTMLSLSGAIPTISGEVLIEGKKTSAPLHSRVRAGLGLVTEERCIFRQLTLAENLRVCGGDSEAALEMFPELKSRLKVKAGMLSGGEQQMLALSRALCRNPKLLLADELSLGLAPLVVDRLLKSVKSVALQGVAVLLVEQHVRKVLEYADRVYVMARGRISFSGTSSEMGARLSDIEDLYLADEGTG